MSLQRVVKPQTQRGKRFLENKEPKLQENSKRAIFIRGSSANNVVVQLMKDMAQLKRPHSVFFNKKNDMKPMEDATSLEFFCEKNEASLFMFGSHNKKRPNNLIIGRTHGYHTLDMFELGVEDYIPLKDFQVPKVAVGSKPMLLFTEGFDKSDDYKRLRNLFIDFFRGPVNECVSLQDIEHLIQFAIIGDKIAFRSYKVSLKKNEQKSPAVELVEIGPRMNFTIRRTKVASCEMFKKACKKPPQLKPKKVKNKKKDPFGTTQGRIHMERQDYKRLQTRKLRGLKRKKGEVADGERPPKALKSKNPDSHSVDKME